jgi:hypothetical protein
LAHAVVKQRHPAGIAIMLRIMKLSSTRAMMRWVVNVLQSPIPISLACSRMMVEADFRDEMRKIAISTLLVHGDRDRSAQFWGESLKDRSSILHFDCIAIAI